MTTGTSGPLVRVLPPEEMTEEARDYLERYREKVSPDVTYVGVMGHASQFLWPLSRLGRTLSTETTLEPRLLELVRLKIARANQCDY